MRLIWLVARNQAPIMLLFVLPWPLPLFTERMHMLRMLGECFTCAFGWPLWGRVDFYHVLITDALTSLTLGIFEFEFSVCHFATTPWDDTHVIGTDGMTTEDHCGHGTFNGIYIRPIMIALPFWLRFVQCVYLFRKSRHGRGWYCYQHLANAGKYLCALLVVFTSTMVPDSSSSNVFDRWR